MNSRVGVEGDLRVINKPVLAGYSIALLLALGALTIYLVFQERYPFLLALAATPVVLLIITQPRWALYQYIFCLFVTLAVDQEIPILLTDISAGVVIVAAALDLLMDNRLPERFPRLFFNFVFLLAAVSITAVFGYDPVVSLRPMAKITFLLATFLSLYRLSAKADIEHLVRFFFWVCVVHSVIVVISFAASGGEVRSFGFAQAAFDDLAMLALPMGLALFVWSTTSGAAKYLFASMLILGGLIATQSRASLAFAVSISIVALLLSIRRARQMAMREPFAEGVATAGEVLRTIKKRIGWVCLAVFVLAAATFGLIPEFRNTIVTRLETVFTLTPTGTLRTRLVLWKTALTAFSSHPVLGIGPGSFRTLHYVLPTLHMQPLHVYVRGLSAHNLFLHYLAETGLLGTSALVALFVNQYRITRSTWGRELPIQRTGCSLALYLGGLLFLITTFLEAGWMWGQSGFIFVLFAALIVRYQQQLGQ